MPGLAGPADDRPLGHSGPGGDREGSKEEQRRAFFNAYNQLAQRISIFCTLPLAKLDRLTLQKKLDEIGHLAQPPPV